MDEVAAARVHLQPARSWLVALLERRHTLWRRSPSPWAGLARSFNGTLTRKSIARCQQGVAFVTVYRFETTSASETRSLGRSIATLLQPGDVVLLHGDLGAGKTTMVQGIGMALGTRERAQSPTFSLVVDTPLPSGAVLRHIDLYRLEDPDELETIGFEDLIEDDRAITVIEWPERAVGMLPDVYLLIELEPSGPDRRSIAVRPVGLGDRFHDL